MKKFVIHSVKSNTSIMEVECSVVTPIDDPSVLWALQPGEYKVYILAPELLMEKKQDGTIAPMIYYSHAVYESLEDAEVQVEKDTRQGFETAVRKHKIDSYTEKDVQKKLAEVKVIML